MIRLKNLLKEDPDGINYEGGYWDWYTHGVYTFLVYDDLIDKKKYWVAWDVKNYNLLCENRLVEQEAMNIVDNEDEEDEDTYIGDNPTHDQLIQLLHSLKRCQDDRSIVECDGRVFNVGRFIMSFWDEDSEVIKYRNKLDDFFKRVGINVNKLLIQRFESDYDEYDDEVDIFVSYRKFFGEKPKEASVLAKQKMMMAKDLHIKKAQLDRAILNALQEKPQSFNDLYVSLEKQLGMPIARIRSEFRGIPLDNIIVRQLRSLSSKKDNGVSVSNAPVQNKTKLAIKVGGIYKFTGLHNDEYEVKVIKRYEEYGMPLFKIKVLKVLRKGEGEYLPYALKVGGTIRVHSDNLYK